MSIGPKDGLRLMHDHFPGCPDFIPWHKITKLHDERAQQNHSQSLYGLNARGGVSPLEFRAIAENKEWSALYGNGWRGNGIGLQHYYDSVNCILAFLGLPALPSAEDPELQMWKTKNRL